MSYRDHLPWLDLLTAYAPPACWGSPANVAAWYLDHHPALAEVP